MAADAKRAKELFLQALEQSDPGERSAWLDRECGGDASLRRRVEVLLAAYDEDPDSDQVPAPAPADPAADPVTGAAGLPVADPEATVDHATESYRSSTATAAGRLVADRYKLLQQIGEGGMGTVWMAEQTEPVRRRVAVKLVRAERSQSRAILTRFEAERQAIALMDHPHIAKLLDAGTAEDGSPFFVMELIKGVPITQFCDAQRLDIPARLRLFQQVCQAVQHAHQKGIIHRDLKPSNILVESHEGKPVPKVIDFGLAKATTGLRLTEQTLFTGFGSVMGTPLYMAPEQAAFDAVDVDTRADIYALGVILYELVTGTTPITRETLKKAALDEMLRLVREQEAPTPSSRLGTSEGLPSVAANRQAEPRKLGRFVKGDLDWIAMKALAKERERRYETASGFARDVERFLDHEPVAAGPPTAAYRLKKFVRRHRGQVVAASAVLLALVAGMAGTTWGLFQARSAAAAERSAKEQTARRLAQIEKGVELFAGMLTGINPRNEELGGPTVYEQLRAKAEAAADQLDGESVGDPVAVARLQNNLGSTLRELGNAPKAIEILKKAVATNRDQLGPDHPDTLTSMNSLALGYWDAGQLERAQELLERTLELMKAKLGPDHRTTLASMSNLAGISQAAGQLDRALPLMEQTLELMKAKLGPDHPDTLVSMNNLALCYKGTGQFDRALQLLERTFELQRAKLGPDHADTLTSMNSLAVAFRDAGQVDRALPHLERVLELQKSRLGPDHPYTLTSMNNLASGYRAAGQLDRALLLLERALELQKTKLGPDHPDTLMSMNNLASGYNDAGQVARALPLLEQTLELRKAKLGPEHPDTLMSMGNLAGGYQDAGQLDRALLLFERALQLTNAKLGPDHPYTLTSMNNLALAYKATGRLDRALPLYERGLELSKTKLGPDHPDTLTSMNNLAGGYRAAGQLDRALPLLEQTLELRKAKLGPEHPDTLSTMSGLAAGFWSAGQLDRSIPLFEEVLPLQEKKLGRQHPNTQHTVANLGVNYRDAGRLDEALPLLKEAYHASRTIPDLRWISGPLLDVYVKAKQRDEGVTLARELLAEARKSLPQESPQLAGVLNQHAFAFLRLEAFAEAEPPLREALKIREAHELDAWTTFNTRSLLGGALLGQKKYDEAGPLLLSGFEGMKAREATIPPQANTRIPEALDRLIALYEATDRPEEAEKWRAEQGKSPEPASRQPVP